MPATNLFPFANRGNVGVPLGHQNGDSSLGPMVTTQDQVESELIAPMGFFPRRQFYRPGFFPLNPMVYTDYEVNPIYYRGPNLIGRRTKQSAAERRINDSAAVIGAQVGGY